MSDDVARHYGFPKPREGAIVRDPSSGLIWHWSDEERGLGELGSWVAPVIGAGGSIGGGIVAGAIGGAWGGPIGAGIGVISSLIAGIFASHAAKVQREDQISNAWAASGPQAIDAVMQAYRSGQISGREASGALDQIEAQFRSMTQPITKYKGKFGSFPDPTAPRPGNQCNWACGTSWDLHQQLQQLKGQLSTGGSGGGLNLGSITSDPVAIGGLLLLAYLFMKK